MSLFQALKPKSAGKIMIGPSVKLEQEVLSTLAHISHMVGATLGPGGKQVLLERSELGMKPIVTKDGATVIKHLGYTASIKQLILEAARDAAIRTAAEAGDGTTTSTILSSSIANSTAEMVKANKRLSPQKIVREMQQLVPFVEQCIEKHKLPITTDNYDVTLRKVALLSANGDSDLADAVMEALDTVGDEGNMTIVEVTGKSKYEIERLDGYTIDQGYEESCRNFGAGFINDKSGTMVKMDNPIFVLYDGVINDLYPFIESFNKLNGYFDEIRRQDRHVVLMAHGFSDTTVGELYTNWNDARSNIKIFPLLTPQSAIMNWRTHFLYDIQSYTGAPIYNPIDKQFSDMNPGELVGANYATYFESGRFRSTVMSSDEVNSSNVELRVDELQTLKQRAESEYEMKDLEVRIGKLTAGIARLNIYGPSQGETREKRDRAEDAWMAIRGAIRHGACPGGGYVLISLYSDLMVLSETLEEGVPKIAAYILGSALLEPIKTLYANYGYVEEEINQQIREMIGNTEQTFDISEQKWVNKFDLLDSVPAVLEAIRNSISIASLLGTIGGIVAFHRDAAADAEESKGIRDYEKTTGEVGND